MSMSLNLVIYKTKEDKLIEDDVRTVQFEELSPVLLKRLTDSFPLEELPVYFDENLEEHFEIECFNNSQIQEILDMLKKDFLELIKHEHDALVAGKTSKNEVQLVENDTINTSDDPLNKAVARFHILTGVIKLFEKKHLRLSDDVGAVIKLG
ncbi:hypothetical protein K0I63_05785 [Shewanella rhizosphaerae]|uniref:hypothetical protein n=1 Tax=Shewanella rhizosphaerae TaxID=2864207 RepID=UPI001C6578AA|nr:hypothetical protein [Shewanella rhizosphaerae]QYK14026.1 hypothetical protein K0I63_05785 [Shewanella rhizosphaerae]